MTLDNATVDAMVRVKVAVMALLISVASSGGRAPGVVAIVETAEVSIPDPGGKGAGFRWPKKSSLRKQNGRQALLQGG